VVSHVDAEGKKYLLLPGINPRPTIPQPDTFLNKNNLTDTTRSRGGNRYLKCTHKLEACRYCSQQVLYNCVTVEQNPFRTQLRSNRVFFECFGVSLSISFHHSSILMIISTLLSTEILSLRTEDRQGAYNVTLRRVRVTTIAV